MKSCICAIAKNENNYIDNWCRYYFNLGVDHIYIYDNNDSNSKYIGDFISLEFKHKITIINVNNIHEQSFQIKCYDEFYHSYGKNYDWCMFIDIDEFLTGVDNINDWLSSNIFDDVEIIRIKWKLFGDDDIIERNLTIPVQDFFKNAITTHAISNQGKCIIRSNLNDINIKSCHYGARYLKSKEGILLNGCLPSGKPCFSRISIRENYSTEKIFLNHYMTKTLSEFINQKFNRGDAIFKDRAIDLSYFWRINTKTDAKMKWLRLHNIDTDCDKTINIDMKKVRFIKR